MHKHFSVVQGVNVKSSRLTYSCHLSVERNMSHSQSICLIPATDITGVMQSFPGSPRLSRKTTSESTTKEI